MSDLLVTDVATGGRVGTATRPPRGKLKGLSAGSTGRRRPESFLIVEESAWPRRGWEASSKGPVTSRRELPFRCLVPD